MAAHSTITDAVIKHLMTIPEMLAEFPFLRYAKTAAGSKEARSCCGKARRSGAAAQQAFETVKASIAYLPPERIALIKKALRVDTLTISVVTNGKEAVFNR